MCDYIGFVIAVITAALAAERTYRRFERYIEAQTPDPVTHLEMPPPPTHRRVLTIDIPPRDLERND